MRNECYISAVTLSTAVYVEHEQLSSTRQTKTPVLSVCSTPEVAVATDCVQGFFDNSEAGSVNKFIHQEMVGSSTLP